MTEISDLEARARAAAQTLVDRKKHENELQHALEQLQGQVRQLQAENQRLASEVATAVRDKTGLLEENQQLREDNHRLSESSGQHKGDLERVSKEVERLLGENERITSLMEALVAQIELNLQGDAGSAAFQEAAANAAEALPDGGAQQVAQEPRSPSVVSEMRDRYHRDPIDEVTDERARSLLSSIKSRL